jgi:predicted phage-related endonuclease
MKRLAQRSVTTMGLDLTNTSLEIAVADIDKFSNDDYIILRRQGFGASDSSVILGVNPYKTLPELIKEKASNIITAEERAVGKKVAVRKGLDLEPLIIQKFEHYFKKECFKPKDMYKIKNTTCLNVNFDGVTGDAKQYIPAEIKVVTQYGEKHYIPTKAMFDEINGFMPLPEDISNTNNSIETKAAHYGIPAYYYTQLQQQMLGLNAPYGYLSVLFDKEWVMRTFFVWRDDNMLNQLIEESHKAWQQVLALKGNL